VSAPLLVVDPSRPDKSWSRRGADGTFDDNEFAFASDCWLTPRLVGVPCNVLLSSSMSCAWKRSVAAS